MQFESGGANKAIRPVSTNVLSSAVGASWGSAAFTAEVAEAAPQFTKVIYFILFYKVHARKMSLICQVVWVKHEGIGRPQRKFPENLIQKTNKCNESQPTRMALG